MRFPLRALSGGEVDPDLHYASDLVAVRNGAAKVRNYIVRHRGGVERRPGTEFVAVAREDAVCLRRFQRSPTAAYICEYGHTYVRVRAVSGDEPVDLSTPWTAAQARCLRTTQSNDIQWIFSGGRVRELQRQLEGFALVASDFDGGPYLDPNPDEPRVVIASGVAKGATVTLTVTGGDLFAAGHVGALWRLDESEFSPTPAWVQQRKIGTYAGSFSDPIPAGGTVRYDDKTYGIFEGGETSNNPPIHEEGDWIDGIGDSDNDPVGFRYLHSGYGVVRIASVLSPTQATAEVMRRLPDQIAIGPGTNRWREGAWSDYRGWPRVGTLYKNSLWAAGTEWQPSHLWKSVIDGLDNFEPGTNDDSAITRTLLAQETEAISWLAAGTDYMAIGAGGTEFVARPDKAADTVRPNNLITTAATNDGSAEVPGLSINAITVHTDASRTRLIGMKYDFGLDAWTSDDLSLVAGHILGAGVIEMHYQRSPWPIVWLLLESGKVAGFTYLAAEKVAAWHVHDFGDPVESMCTLAAPGGRSETLAILVRRGEKLCIERLSQPLYTERGETSADGTYLDSSIRFRSDEPMSECSGLDHLNGRQVVPFVDGREHPPVLVVGGRVTLEFPGRNILVGLPFWSVWKSLPADFGQMDDDQVSRRKRTSDIGIALRNAQGGVIRMGDREEPLFRLGDTPLDQAPPLFTGVRSAGLPASDDSGQVEIATNSPWSLTINAVFPEFEV